MVIDNATNQDINLLIPNLTLKPKFIYQTFKTYF